MQRIPVKLASNPYDVVIGSGGLQNLGQEMLNSGISAPRKVLVVSNADVAGPYGATVLESLRSSGFEADSLVIEAGEDQKHLGTVSQIHDAAHRPRLERGSLMVALGGGVVGMTGRCGYLVARDRRGAGPDHPSPWWTPPSAAKQGSTIQWQKPDRCFPTTQTGPDRSRHVEHTSGSRIPRRDAEVIKYGVIGDPGLFDLLESYDGLSEASALPDGVLQMILER